MLSWPTSRRVLIARLRRVAMLAGTDLGGVLGERSAPDVATASMPHSQLAAGAAGGRDGGQQVSGRSVSVREPRALLPPAAAGSVPTRVYPSRPARAPGHTLASTQRTVGAEAANRTPNGPRV